jgi:3-hydroxyisobutyrate dehydrogenase
MSADNSAQSAAVLGTGIMGSAMARNLARAGISTAAWNHRIEHAMPLRDSGIEVFSEPWDAVRERDAVLTVLSEIDVVRSVMSATVFDAMQHDAVWIQSSTVGIEGTRETIDIAKRAGVRLLDAPVSGTKAPAEAGELVVLASGDERAAAYCKPVFDAIGAKTVWLGDAGRGTRMKLVTNDWVLGQTALLAEAIRLCEAMELEPAEFLASIDGAPVGSTYAQVKGKMMIAGDYQPSFPLQHGAKDTRLIVQAAADAGLQLPIASATASHFAQALAEGAGADDVAAVFGPTRPASSRRGR